MQAIVNDTLALIVVQLTWENSLGNLLRNLKNIYFSLKVWKNLKDQYKCKKNSDFREDFDTFSIQIFDRNQEKKHAKES